MSGTDVQMFFTALTLGFGVLHLILFVFIPRQKSNLYFALFALLMAANIYLDFETLFIAQSGRPGAAGILLRWHRAAILPIPILLLRFIYSFFFDRLPRRFWAYILLTAAAAPLLLIEPMNYLVLYRVISLIVFADIAFVLIPALRARREGAGLLTGGVGLLFLFILLDFDWLRPLSHHLNGGFFVLTGSFLVMSISLARSLARTQERVIASERAQKEKEVQQRLLEADLARKNQELEEARQLQLSMLPNDVPKLEHLKIAVHMKTATEVGGDYYDFSRAEDGSLTAVIGDATGHGIKAGIMVTLVKSLFNISGGSFYIPDFFNHCTSIIKRMNLGNLFMAMTLIRINGYRMIASAAGCPPLLIYRRDKREIEEIVMKGMPLGAHENYSYQQIKSVLAPGDTLLLMTDGYPELFNERYEMLDYGRVKELFLEIADSSPELIIAHLSQAGEAWRGGRPQDDDITFVVIKAT